MLEETGLTIDQVVLEIFYRGLTVGFVVSATFGFTGLALTYGQKLLNYFSLK